MEFIQIRIAIVFLVLGIPVGNLLAKFTKEELKDGRKWFKLIIMLSLLGAIVLLILGKDALLFGLLFIAIVTSRSLKR
jgi:hypothetical protein